MPYTARVITVSDRSAAGLREDRGGPLAVSLLRDAGFDCADAAVVPDGADSVETALRAALAAGAGLVVTTGGTGIAPTDRTPEGTARVIDRELPGIAEELRRRGLADTPLAVISRGLAGIADPATLVVNLPGSTRAVASGIAVLAELAPHVLDQLAGGDH
ncbi:MAG: molybdenum cofactor biosynthesis protein [Microbacterium sp. 71-36]|uniref:MogA/MoaB family molybdenum cofactor biosynthesis protein n=1 Tax=unclassified Microbacterium TaxID=2609290 RepID=UPI00086E7D06|nr:MULTISPECIES: MogA/MoaB family molybdenum cofactor biosynthesis protein [unclassified Microbacterium]MBN9211243.1 MogA/MoaB family molybdenum cofactor biosynthesis protein [Microbacterium sp.]ODT41912.1 MAG: molybdenum cofactor biosynthesis protein [Microbacterium sp. SCN 71-17]OJV77815.1 MAG: molybdenum cofactor biosynthesis protein [Microbacterium sp. 71-36]